MLDKETVYRAIVSVIEEKRITGSPLCHATSLEVALRTGSGTTVVEAVVRALRSDGRITIGRTLNYDYYLIKK